MLFLGAWNKFAKIFRLCWFLQIKKPLWEGSAIYHYRHIQNFEMLRPTLLIYTHITYTHALFSSLRIFTRRRRHVPLERLPRKRVNARRFATTTAVQPRSRRSRRRYKNRRQYQKRKDSADRELPCTGFIYYLFF